MTIEDIVMIPKGVVIGREIVDASYDEWIAHVFARKFGIGYWRYNNNEFIEWAVTPSDTVDFLTRTFDDCGSLLNEFSNRQIADGLWYIASEENISLSLGNESVPWPKRQQAIRSIRKLYTNCFTTHCAPLLSYLEKGGAYPSIYPPLNGTCYMWWDIFPNMRWLEGPTDHEIENEYLAVMDFALGLESIACQESALHGLGHCFKAYPEFVQATINRFIKTNPTASPELTCYAQSAREGKVL
jgi:hypothetical protein